MSGRSEELDPRHRDGVRLFNAGDYFAAHEVWEHLWRFGPSADRRFYQSLIQAAVALYHRSNGNPAGAQRLARSGREKAAGYPPGHLGVDLGRLWADVDAALAAAPPAVPRITLAGPDGTDHD